MVVFLLAGTFSMSASLCASKLLKLPEEEQPAWVQGQRGKTGALILGNLVALILVAAMVYGFRHLDWWIPLVCLVVTFPVIHVVLLERILGLAKGFVVNTVLACATAVLMGLFW